MTPDDPKHQTADQKWRTVSGCHCLHCEAARATRRRNYKLRRRAHTNPAKVAAHINRLIENGWLQTDIVAVSGVSAPTVSEIRRGIYNTIRVDTAVALLAVNGPAPHTRTVPTQGTLRRIQALAALGWTVRETCRAAGLSERFYAELIDKNRATLSRTSADAIAAVYDERSMQRPPSNAHRKRTQTIARSNGWAPPLAWDCIDTDEKPSGVGHKPRSLSDKYTTNEFDATVVDRVLSGDWHLDATPAERAAVVARWTASGGSLNELERHTGWRVHRYVKGDAA